MVHALADVFLRDLQSQRVAGAVEACQAVFRDGGAFAVDERDAAVALRIDVAHQFLHAAHVVGKDGGAVVEDVIDGHDREAGIDQLQHLRIVEIDTGDHHAVDAAILAVLQVCRRFFADVTVDEGNIIAVGLGLDLETLEHGGKILMRKSAAPLVDEQDADIIGAVRLERAGGGVGHIAKRVSGFADQLPRLLADVRLPGEGLADRRNRNTAGLRDILHRDHAASPPFRPQVFLIVFVISK